MATAEETAKQPETTNLKEEMAMLEAALYVAGRPLDLRTLGNVIKTRSKRKVHEVAQMLREEYNHRDTALEVLELEDQRFVLQLKKDYSSRVRRLAIHPLLTEGPLKTLAYIAFRQPVMQKHVIDVRGSHVYCHIRQLADMGLVDLERKGRTRLLTTTEYFADYFGLSHDFRKMKRQLRRIFKDTAKENTSISKEIDDAEDSAPK